MKAKPVIIGSFYQDQKAGERMIKNVSEFGIPSIWSNGRWNEFEQINDSDISTDNLKEIILSYPNTTVYDTGVQSYGETITFLMEKSGNLGYSHSFLLSCDEYLEGDWNVFCNHLDELKLKEPTRMLVPIVDHGHENYKQVERVVYMPEFVNVKNNLHYIYYHNYFRNETIMGFKGINPLVTGITIHHDNSIRTKKREIQMNEYQKKRKPVEINELANLVVDGKLKRG